MLALLFSLLSLHAQSFMFKHLEVSDGLSNNSVRCIYKDREGLMWFGTLAGLNCYDGYTFKVFTRQEYNQNSLPDNFIESIVELPDGQFWVKTAKGYVLFDKAKEVFQTSSSFEIFRYGAPVASSSEQALNSKLIKQVRVPRK